MVVPNTILLRTHHDCLVSNDCKQTHEQDEAKSFIRVDTKGIEPFVGLSIQ